MDSIWFLVTMVTVRHLLPSLGFGHWSPQMHWPLLSDSVKWDLVVSVPCLSHGHSCQAIWVPTCPCLLQPFPLWVLANFLGLHLETEAPLSSGLRSQQPRWNLPFAQALSVACGPWHLSFRLPSNPHCSPSSTLSSLPSGSISSPTFTTHLYTYIFYLFQVSFPVRQWGDPSLLKYLKIWLFRTSC